MHPCFAPADASPTALDLVAPAGLDAWLGGQPEAVRTQAKATGFAAEAGQVLVLVNPDGTLARVAAGAGGDGDPFVMATLSGGTALPPGDFALNACPEGLSPDVLAAAWADGAYRFERYKAGQGVLRRLALPAGVDREDAVRLASACDWLRDLVNTPASDMGPVELAKQAADLAREHDADCEVIVGRALIEAGYPMVHAVGVAAAQPPRYIEISWGRPDAPRLALVGKGVTFDTGGLNIKTGDYMRIMKKDMGGAAHALALARLVMAARLDVRLTVAVPAVENAVGAGAFRPGDVLTSRKGLTVEIEDTDAEGRLVLADALARVSELDPELVIDFATLTGAARVALGPDLAPLYTDSDALAAGLIDAGRKVSDPVWRMPLWKGYESQLRSPIADMKNLGDGPMAGSVTAALFLKRFVSAPEWAHFDIWAWRPPRYGRPAGAAATGLRAAWAYLDNRYGRRTD